VTSAINTRADSNAHNVPYQNLILSGSLGARAIPTGQIIAKRLGVLFINLDTELQAREGHNADDIRALFGEARLKKLENELCREFALRRGTVLSVNPPTLLDETNRERLGASSVLMLLTCALNETLHRLYVAQGARFQDPKARSAALSTLRRDGQLLQVADLSRLDTTRLSVEQAADRAITFWRERTVTF